MGSSSKWLFPGKNKFKAIKFVIFLKRRINDYGMCSIYLLREEKPDWWAELHPPELALSYTKSIFQA